MSLRQVVFDRYRNPTFISLAAVTSAFALRPNSTILPLIGTLSVLLVYSPFLFRSQQPNRTINIVLTWIALSVGSSLSRLHASLDALSSTGQSLVWLFLLSSLLSLFPLAALYAGTRLTTRFPSPWSQITLFPSVWATLWCTVSYISPVGHLSTWSVANNADAYNWMVPILGPASKDWITGAWAMVISQTLGSWYMGPQSYEDIDLFDPPTESPKYSDNPNTRKILAVFLTILTIPSFFLPTLPLPVSTIETATPLTVGCVIPPYQRYKHHVPTLEDYIKESQKIRGMAQIILWPEGAVVFNSALEREAAFKEVRKRVDGPFVGVSFEETISNPGDPTGRQALTLTGMALVSQYSDEPHLIYYKRHLVPIAESYRLRNSALAPRIFEAQLGPPRDIPKSKWSPNTNHTRGLPISSSICLDFATPSPFAALESRPALILAPARTWDRTVGYAMWLQAKQRAEELGSTILWCDGGEGGVSGIAGQGFNDVTQVGSGSFVRTIGIQYPFFTRPTPFARFGDSVLIFFWLLVLIPGRIGRRTFKVSDLQRGIQNAITRVIRRPPGHVRGEVEAPQQDLLN